MSTKGTRYYNNGKVNKMFRIGDPIPDGFVPGMLKRSEAKNRIIQNKRMDTCQKRYGVTHISKLDEIKEKKKETTLSHYGVENPMQSKEIVDKVKSIHKERIDKPVNIAVDLGVSSGVQSRISLTKDMINSEEGGSLQGTKVSKSRIIDNPNNNHSTKYFSKLLDKEGISYTTNVGVGNYVYDFQVGKILVDISRTDSQNILYKKNGRIDSKYNMYRTDNASSHGYRNVQVFDWDNLEKVPGILRNRKRVFARKCSISEVSKQECADYLDTYHLQNSCNGQTVRLGLFYDNKLVELMTFGKPRYNHKFEWELLRLCSSYFVVGGSEKIFKHFIKMFDPSSIISYCDNSKFEGDVYLSLGFKLFKRNNPSRHWYNPNELRPHITDNFLRQRGYDQLFGAHFGKGTDNNVLMLNRGYLPVYDCGQSTYTWFSTYNER